MKEAGASKILATFNRLKGITFKKTVIFIFTAMRTSDITYV
jgi:hypothetical protein